MKEFLREIGTRYPATRENAEAILRLDSDVDQLPTAPFFEPVSLVEVVDGKRRLLALSADLLNAWRQHAAYGCRVRLRSMERGVFNELKACRLLSAMVLVRAHMKAAAQAAYCEQSVPVPLAHASVSCVGAVDAVARCGAPGRAVQRVRCDHHRSTDRV
jgi:hypothetical protein